MYTHHARTSPSGADPDIVFRPLTEGQERAGALLVDLMRDGRSLSRCTIVPVTIRVGVATVRVDGIGEVGTEPEYREQGLARRVLLAATARMRAGDAALSMLYGIPNFYLRFGYVPAGPEHTLTLPLGELAMPLPPGWNVRAATRADLPALRRLYDDDSADAVGAVVRPADGYPWTKLTRLQPDALGTDCRVIVDPGGGVGAYIWRDRASWFTQHVGEDVPESMTVAEAVARDAPAADAVLTACRAWAREEAREGGRPLTTVTLAIPPVGPVAAAARHVTATFRQTYSADSEFMVRTVHPGRLLRSLAPELKRRLEANLPGFQGAVILETEVGSVMVHVSTDGLHISGDVPVPPTGAHLVRLPQTVLARLALGAFDPADLLARLEAQPDRAARDMLEALFPPRHPHIALPDRF